MPQTEAATRTSSATQPVWGNTMPTAHYRCNKCKRDFKTHKEAKKCEDDHLKPVFVRVVQYTIKPFPYSIEVTFNNDERRIYNAQDLGG
jgi:hypothetical protein